MTDDVQRVLRSMGLEDARPAPAAGGSDDVTRVLRSMGLHDDKPAEKPAPQKSEYAGFQLSDLSGYTPPEETIANFTQADKDRIAEYGPAAVAAAAGLALPVSAPAAAIGGLLLGTAARGATPLLKGEGIDAALKEANPLTHPVQAGLEVGLPFVGKAVARGLAAAPLSKLADFAESTGLDAALPKLDELASWSNASTASKSDVAMSTLQGLRSRISAAAPYLLKSNSDTAKIAGDRLMAYGELERFIQTNGEKIITKAFKGIKPVERETVTQVLNGTLKAENVSPRIAEAARIMRDEFYDPMGRLAEKAGVLTEVKAPMLNEAGEEVAKVGDWIKFRSKANYSPEIPLESKPYVSTDSLRNKLFNRSKVAYQRLPEGENEVALMTDAHDIAQSYLGTMTRKIAASHAFGSPTKSGKFGEVGEQLVNQLYHEAADDPLAPRLLESSLERIYTGKKPDPLEGLAQKASSIAAKVQLGKAALRSIPQIGTNIRQHGLANTIEGLTRYATDPSMRELIEKSGAKATALADYAGDLGVGARTIPMRMQRGIERFNRGAANAGIVPQIEKIGERIASGKKLTTAQERILAELRIKPEEFDGGVTADLVRRAAQRSADDNQLQAMAIGQVGDVIHDPLARAATQYQPFQWAQWRNFQDRVLAPLAHPIDRPAEFLMGLRRAGTGIGATAALSAPVSAIYARSGGRDPELAPMVGDAMETTAGTIGSIGSNMLQGRSPLDPLTPSVPAYSLVKEAYDNPVSIPVNAAAALDPTGAMAVLRSSLLSYLK